MSIQELINQQSVYVLINRDQYEVLLDHIECPRTMWSPVTFSVGDFVTLDGGRPRYEIIRASKQNCGFVTLMRFELRKET